MSCFQVNVLFLLPRDFVYINHLKILVTTSFGPYIRCRICERLLIRKAKEFAVFNGEDRETTGIVMKTSSRSLCFEYCDKQSGETNYIISKYAVKNCEFLPISENDDGDGGSDDDDEIKQTLNKSSSKQKATSKWPGSVELSGTEKAPAAL